jgi:hypothetical protein
VKKVTVVIVQMLAVVMLITPCTVLPVRAQQPVDRTVLPPAEQPFRGKIEMAYKDSKGEFPQPLRAPKGAPNVLLIMATTSATDT